MKLHLSKHFCMRNALALIAVVFVSQLAFGQNPAVYRWFGRSGKTTSWSKVVSACADADIILFGEQHDDAIAHWFQLLLLEELTHRDSTKVALGMEMLERDQQWAVNLFSTGAIDEEKLEDTTNMWSNFHTDYLPSVRFAVEHHLPVVATNIPRRYASMVFKKGVASLDTLSPEVKSWMTPLPFPVDTSLSQYRELVKMGMEMHSSGLNFATAQAIKDATMAHFILSVWKPGMHFLHLNGAYHSDFDQSIEWYLKRKNPSLKVVTISTVSQSQLKKLDSENRNKADFILVTPEDMIRTM